MAYPAGNVLIWPNPALFPAWGEYHRTRTKVTMRDPGTPPNPLESTHDLLSLVREGDRDALERLFTRCVPPLRRWARGRLPAAARGLLETQDLVQDTVLNSLKRLDRFESRHEGALQAYLRQAVVNRIRDEIRRTKRSPGVTELDENAS